MTTTSDDILLPLSPMDAVMHSFGFVILYIFPSPYDLDKLQSSFISTVNEDYPILIGELYVDPATGIDNVKQTPEARTQGATGIRFEKNPENAMTTEKAMKERSWDLMPTTRGKTELICAKGTSLTDGGLAIGVDATHTLFDGEGMFTFMTVWGQHYSEVKKEDRLVVNHDRHLLTGTGGPSTMQHPEFRVVQDDFGTVSEAETSTQTSDQDLFHFSAEAETPAQTPPPTAHELFHFTPQMLKKIKEVAAESLEGEYVSTTDAITALFTVMISRARGHGKKVRITTGVNARRRLEPPLPENYVGNVIFNAFSSYTASELQPEEEAVVSPSTLGKLAKRVRESILQRDNTYLRDAIDFLMEQKNISAVQVGTDFVFGPDLMFTSWVHMGMYNAAFDGTHPWYACVPKLPCFDGFIMITEAQKGEVGVDVGVFLECSAMEKVKKMFADVKYLHTRLSLTSEAMVNVISPVAIEDDVFIPLSAMDAVMSTYRVVILYIYPPSSTAYSLTKLQRSFINLVDEDYPILVGELHVEQKTGAVSVKQSPLARQQGGAGVRFEMNSSNSQSTKDAMESRSWDLMPKPRSHGEIIAVKGSILSDGGMAIGVDCSHVLFDGEATLTFMRAWGQHYSGVLNEDRLVINHERYLLNGSGKAAKLPHPEFQLVPAEPLIRREDGSLAPKAVVTPPKTFEHVFHLSSLNMAKLKKFVENEPAIKKSRLPMRKRERFVAKLVSLFKSKDKKVVQALTAPKAPYISTLDAITALFTVLISRARGHGQQVRVSTAVNGRTRLEPPLPANYSGNAVFHAISTYQNEELDVKGRKLLPLTVSKVAHDVRASILERDNEFMRDTIAFLSEQKDPTAINDNVNFFFGPDVAFTCWAKMGLYEAEFDGQKPTFAKIPRVQCMDGFVLITEALGGSDGLDVLVCLEANTMEKLKEITSEVEFLC
ncbi:Hydroxycinnamoyltransferase 1 [Phytophthora citrophthora]|uniref:Hydroxycinnamoyltransferase 1 n=1 Tax=Phytophthora citrophthora TaxID=4793 RepID=A0AAD9GDV0_9STRA|nr:Hydroxycinnamoyltransferase 1 [Phytophthora citrophthora]